MLPYRTRRRLPLTPACESPCDRASGLLADAEPIEREGAAPCRSRGRLRASRRARTSIADRRPDGQHDHCVALARGGASLFFSSGKPDTLS
ncbi:LysR family transcriptional regulator [Burkholderia multivorans]|nr:LysR family transcriptional regulator [Burkholderia multivorans]PRF87825.1 LysR family transcriptional regulator [Burkholderia multivorans]PRG61042.1 LysR family transcriptional regulator [Burkholderia multivorans]